MKKNNLWLGVSLLMLVALVLPSCAPKAVTPTTIAPPPTEVTIAEVTPTAPKPEGTVTIGIDSAYEESFLPWFGGAQSMIWEQVYDYLIYTKLDGTYVGGLAERWEVSPDATSVTLWLRKGIQFHEGYGEVTTADVKYTLDRIMGEDSANTRATALRDGIDNMELVDSYTIIFHLKKADPVFWLLFTDLTGYSLPIVCKAYVEKVGDEVAMNKPIGTGPFILVDHKFGDYLTFEAVPDHWRVVPEFQYLTLKIIPEASTATAMLSTGAVDAITVNAGDIPNLEAAGFKTFTVPGGEWVYLVFGGMVDPSDKRYVEGYSQQDPWKDVKVREAMNIAIDRQAIIDVVYFGSGYPIANAIACPTGACMNLAPIPYDPEKAKQLLAEAGYPDGFSFNVISYPRDPEVPTLMEAVVGYWEAIGLKPKIVMGDYATFKGENFPNGKTAGMIFQRSTGFRPENTPSMLNSFYIDGTTPMYQDPALQALLEAVVHETDWAKRSAAWDAVGKYSRDNYIAHIPHLKAVFIVVFNGFGA